MAKTSERGRSAIDGRFVSKDYAASHPPNDCCGENKSWTNKAQKLSIRESSPYEETSSDEV